MNNVVTTLAPSFFSSPQPKALCELIGWDIEPASVGPSIRASVHTFRHEYL